MTSSPTPTPTPTTKRLGRCYLLRLHETVTIATTLRHGGKVTKRRELVFFVVSVVVVVSLPPPPLLPPPLSVLPIQPVTQQPLLMVELVTDRPTDFVLHYVNRVESIVYANGRANPGNPDTSARLRWSLRSDYSKIPQGTQHPQMESTGSSGNVHLIPQPLILL
ncbi:hypothetical protein HZH66_014154 [Vespula vulgaris]|uniref:Uncharacterized protein n=1 Tax=Vespula vulgaris TaxID=7454 RepID=A0A834MS00_VESVU|nr:hypothetical protein HZH66_014154 [Vespula vulgaris]